MLCKTLWITLVLIVSMCRVSTYHLQVSVRYMCCYSALHTLQLYKTKQNWGYQLRAKMNPALPPLEAVDISFSKDLVGWLCWGLTSQSTIFQSYRDGAIASWVINQYFRGVKCLAQGHNTAAVGLEPRTSRSGVRHSTTEPPRSPL